MLRGLTEELAEPKYSHLERERRWLVSRMPQGIESASGILIEDRYLARSRLRVRRMTDEASGRVVLKLTKKYPTDDPRERPMVTSYLDDSEYASLCALPAAPLRKRRLEITEGALTFSLDLFEGPLAGRAIVEIEAASEQLLTAIVKPSWAAMEITDKPAYSCAALARDGWPKEN